ncbi:MAG TPA: hypothetical protein VGF55_07450 [Gemmataceae bacterium]|jgi:hypothetical protein
MSRSACHTLAALAAVGLCGASFVGFGLWFNPGWANLRRGGLEVQLLWPAGLSAFVAVVLMTASAGTWVVWAAGSDAESGRNPGGAATAAWFVLTAVGTAVVAGCLFVVLHRQAVAMWPAGYNP